MRTFPLATGLCFALLGCTEAFAPRVDASVAKNMAKANGILSEIAACIELNTCDGKTGFKKVEKDYAKAFAAVSLSLESAEGLEPGARLAGKARDLFVTELSVCKDQIRTLHDAHRKFPSLRKAGLVGPVLVSCQLPLDAAIVLQ